MYTVRLDIMSPTSGIISIKSDQRESGSKMSVRGPIILEYASTDNNISFQRVK